MKFQTAKDLSRREAEEKYLTKLHGPLPTNPFKTLRVNAGFSLQGLATQSQISKQALLKAEQGLYANPLPSLVDYWMRRPSFDVSELDITEGYENFRYAVRRRNLHYFGDSLHHAYSVAEPLHPFRQLRKNKRSHVDGELLPVGLTECAQALCIPIDTLQFWEKKFRQQQSVPKQVIEALKIAGYTQYEVQQFCRDYTEWRERYRKLKASNEREAV